MRAKLVAALAAALAISGVGGDVHAQAKPKKISVAVMDFDYGTIDHWWGQYDIGKGMADQVVDALVNDGTYRVIERKKLDTVLAEQDFSRSDRAAPSAGKLSKVGKVLGIRYIISGSITKFATESRGGALSVKGIGLGGSKAKSTVELTARMIDTTTGEILISAKGKGESGKGGSIGANVHGVGASTAAEEWRTAGLAEAQERATVEVVKLLVAKIGNLE
jgi:curli biogenesis system outer membrane secretion channel CsgG